jgi:hypothetical protein
VAAVGTSGISPSSVPVAGVVIPTGAPHTGFGGAARSRNTFLMILGCLALAAAIVSGSGVRRSAGRRSLWTPWWR